MKLRCLLGEYPHKLYMSAAASCYGPKRQLLFQQLQSRSPTAIFELPSHPIPRFIEHAFYIELTHVCVIDSQSERNCLCGSTTGAGAERSSWDL